MHDFGVFLALALIAYTLAERALERAYQAIAPAWWATLELTPGRRRRYMGYAMGLLTTILTTGPCVWLLLTGRAGATPLHGYTRPGLAMMAARLALYLKEISSLRDYRVVMVHHAMTLAGMLPALYLDVAPRPSALVFASLATEARGGSSGRRVTGDLQYLCTQHGLASHPRFGLLMAANLAVFVPLRFGSMPWLVWELVAPAPGDELPRPMLAYALFFVGVYFLYSAFYAYTSVLKLAAWRRARKAAARAAKEASAAAAAAASAAAAEEEEGEGEAEGAESGVLLERWGTWAQSGPITLDQAAPPSPADRRTLLLRANSLPVARARALALACLRPQSALLGSRVAAADAALQKKGA